MISWIVFFLGAVVSFTWGWIVNYINMKLWQIVVIFAISLAIIIAINGIVATICSKVLPNKCFNKDSKFYTPSKLECAIYEKFGVKQWKGETLEWGRLNGFKKKKMKNAKDVAYIERFILESNKGFLTHFVSVFMSALIFVVVPRTFRLSMALPMFITSFLLNLMPIMILRYNIPRLKTLLRYLQKHNNESK